MSLHLYARPKRRSLAHRTSTKALFVATAGMLVAAVVNLPALAAVKDPSVFELDNNAQNNATIAGDDWENVLLGNGGSSIAHTANFVDPAGQTIFTTGGSKDDLDVTSWRHTSGSVPDKDEITDAYAAAYVKDGDLLIYFGSDRLAQNGSSNVGFWFLKDQVGPVADGTFSGKHEVGDILVLSEFSNGGAVSTVQVFEWDPAHADTNGTLKSLFSSNSADCDDPNAPANACATTNAASTPAPWSYSPKQGPAGTFPKGAFFEGGINMSALLGGGQIPCVSSFVAETRSSPSVDATLKDFSASSFPLCSAGIQITGNGVNEVGVHHTFTVTTSKIAAGVSSAAVGVKPTVTLTANPTATVTVDSDTCSTTGTNSSGVCTVEFHSDTATVITGHASATIPVGGEDFTVETDGTAPNSGDVIKRFVDAQLDIAPNDTNGIGEPHTFTVTAQADLGSGTWVAATDGHVDVTTVDNPLTMNSTQAGTAAQNTCRDAGDNLDSNGQCTFTIVSSKAGTVTAHAAASLNLTTAQGNITLTRETDGAANNSDNAVKTFVDGSLAWIKHDGDGALLGGATFEVCRTHDFVSATSTFTDITDVCVSVVDNSAPDTDADDGEFKMEHLVLGRYTVHETAAPEGYALDPDTESADLTIASPNVSITPAFVDLALYKLIVITCNTTTEKLVDSTVTLGGVDKETLTSASTPTEEQICGLGGASYDDLTANTYNPSVELPDKAPLFPTP